MTGVDNRQAVQFINESTDNRFLNNVVVAVSDGGQLLATDGTTVDSNTLENNAWPFGLLRPPRTTRPRTSRAFE